jgi:hypothetical protein
MPNRPSQKRLDIEAELLTRYPCNEIPIGGLSELGVKYGVTRERIRQISVGLGMVGGQKRAAALREIKKQYSKQCRNCGKPRKLNSYLCIDCSHPKVSCTVCGTLVRRRKGQIARNNAKGAYCSWTCRNKNLGVAASVYHGKTPGETRALVEEYMDWMSVSDLTRLIGVKAGTVAFHITRIREGK